jgi:hypothetical protein
MISTLEKKQLGLAKSNHAQAETRVIYKNTIHYISTYNLPLWKPFRDTNPRRNCDLLFLPMAYLHLWQVSAFRGRLGDLTQPRNL